jgi:hypothetical protein
MAAGVTAVRTVSGVVFRDLLLRPLASAVPAVVRARRRASNPTRVRFIDLGIL